MTANTNSRPQFVLHHGLQRRQQHQAAHREQRLTAYDDVDVQQVQKRQPERIKRMLAQREPIVFSQPVPGGDALGKVEHQRVVDGGKIRRGDDELEAAQAQLDGSEGQRQYPQPPCAQIPLRQQLFQFRLACLLLRRAGAGRRLLGSRADVPHTAMATIVYYYITISTACATRAAHVRAEG